MNKEKYTLQEVTTPALEREWLDFPKRIYKGNRNWVCPLDVDVLEVFNPSKNELFADGEAIRWAASEGVAGGYGGGQFGPGDPVTREQFAVMLHSYAQNQGYDVSIGENTNILSYTDVADLSEYAIPAMQWAVGAGIINGTGDGSTLTPQGQATRAQAAVMLMQFCEAYMTW